MRASWIIGAADGCDIRVDDTYVSGRHCRLEREGDEWFLEDLGSTNGTFVNGIRLTGRVRVTSSDRITMGRSRPMPWPCDAAARPRSVAKSVPLPPVGQSIVLGREARCDIVLDFPMVSGRHALIEHVSTGWVVRDLGSTNGTFVGGRRITDTADVHPGDVIGLGSYQFRLSRDGQSLVEEDRRDNAILEVSSIDVSVGDRVLIRDVSLTIQSGELVGILGPSGAGKSTLLSALVGYEPPATGRVMVSGVDLYVRQDEFRGQIGYVPQDDIMHPDLTVGRALTYSARLRLPRDFSNAEIDQRIAAVTDQLGLSEVLHTRIGSPDRRGISGGQRKRVNVAMELVTDPPIVVLDEPTSGLSSTDALSLMRVLRRIASSGKLVILTIHQPSIDVLKLMDGVAVMAKDATSRNAGEIVWFGAAYPDAANFFEPGTDRPDAEAVLRGLDRRTVAEWRAAYRKTESYERLIVSRQGGTNSPASASTPKKTSILESISHIVVLARRMVSIKAADRWGTAVLLAQAPLIGVLIAAIFGPKVAVTVDAAHWADVSRAIATTTFLMALAAVWFGCSNAAREIVNEQAIFRRERMAGLSPFAYLASKVVVLAALCCAQCAMLVAIVHVGVGLHAGFWSVLWPLVLAANVAVAIGLCVSALVRTPDAAAGLLPLVLLPMVILGGILLPLRELPTAATYVADAMPSRWAFEKLLTSEADARPLLEVPTPDDPSGTTQEDLAEPWFPMDGWRSSPAMPGVALTTIGLLALATVQSILVGRGQRR